MLKKTHTPRNTRTLTCSNHLLKFGSCGFKVLTTIRLTKQQLESLDRILIRKIKSLIGHSKNYRIWSLITPNKTLTKLSPESRMGKGKGSVFTEAAFLKKGTVLYEFKNIKHLQILEVFNFFKKHVQPKLVLIFKK